MEFGGTEKRIQALFSELSLEDCRRTPRFEQLWTRIEKTTPAPAFRLSFVFTAAAVIIVAGLSFALWSIPSESVLNIAPLEIPTFASPQFAVVVESPRSQPSHHKRPARPRRPVDVSLREAALLSSWQSPTENFMQSPSGVSFNSLPQLNQSAKDLESFLTKEESNQ